MDAALSLTIHHIVLAPKVLIEVDFKEHVGS
jgi:hypothetical protein